MLWRSRPFLSTLTEEQYNQRTLTVGKLRLVSSLTSLDPFALLHIFFFGQNQSD